MAGLKDFQAAILEESILYLIRVCGYREIGPEEIDIDSTLTRHHAGMGVAVKGRGANHQIDCIGDYIYTPPLCNPIRLLGETKFYGFRQNGAPKKVGLGEIRDAVGLLKDVSEFFSKSNDDGVVRRFSYQSVFFSATGFTKNAQEFAYAHDVNLISAFGGGHLRNIVDTIRSLELNDFRNEGNIINLKGFRQQLRNNLRDSLDSYLRDFNNDAVSRVISEVKELDRLFLGTIDNKLTIMLVPIFNTDEWISLVNYALAGEELNVSLHWSDQPNEAGDLVFHVFEYSRNPQREIFQFLIPSEILMKFLNDGILYDEAALNLKEQYFSSIKIPFVFRNAFTVLKLCLDRGWLRNIQQSL